MAKLRWTLLLLAIGIALPATLIVIRAQQSLELETTYRHETVAERIFDEMERSLSDFLLREQARPPDDYDRALGSALANARSDPAFTVAAAPYVLGWFRIGPGGRIDVLPAADPDADRLTSVLRGAIEGSGSRSAREGQPEERPADDGSIAERTRAEEDGALRERKDAAPAPGRTKSVGRARVDKRKRAESEADVGRDPLASADESTAYEVLQNLNRAGSLRSERQSKAVLEGAHERSRRSRNEAPQQLDRLASREPTGPNEAAASAAPPAPLAAKESSGAGGARGDRLADSSFANTMEDGIPDAAALELEMLGYADADSEKAGRPEPRVDSEHVFRVPIETTERTETAAGRLAASIVDPLIGRLVDDDTIVLTRSVWRAERVERQGVVLDRATLVEWLREQVLGRAGLLELARVDFGAADSFIAVDGDDEIPEAMGPYRYLHRFAEPFDGLIARLDLHPLPDSDTGRSIHALALLLAIAAGIGLFAVDRMTRVVVDFAKRRSDFVAAVSHELKTPLTAIRMYGEMLRDGLVPSENKRAEYYATITDESERLSRLIDNVLEFSRLEQNRRESDIVIGDPTASVRAAVDRLRPHAERSGLALVFEADEPLPRVRFDRDALTQIVFNLVDNAIKYAADSTPPRIEMALARGEDTVLLSVRDFGGGVEATQLERIFEPFYRVGDELTRTNTGTGIGLALVRELAVAMGGSVRAERADGGGLRVTVALGAA